MKLFDFNPARNYCEWHEIATKGLCQDAKDRILAEIEAHYADGLRELLDAGKTGADEAHRAAMAALGNPRHARKAFRRAYLTKAEYESLRSFTLAGAAGILRLTECILFGFIAGIAVVLGVAWCATEDRSVSTFIVILLWYVLIGLARSFTFSSRHGYAPITEWILFGPIAGIAVVLGVAWCATEDRSVSTFIVVLLWYVLIGLVKSALKLSGIVERRSRRVLGSCILVSAATFFLLAICVIVRSALFWEVFNRYFALHAWGGLLLMCCVSLGVCIVPLEDMFRLGIVLLKLGRDTPGSRAA